MIHPQVTPSIPLYSFQLLVAYFHNPRCISFFHSTPLIVTTLLNTSKHLHNRYTTTRPTYPQYYACSLYLSLHSQIFLLLYIFNPTVQLVFIYIAYQEHTKTPLNLTTSYINIVLQTSTTPL